MEKLYKDNPQDIDELIGKTFNSWTIVERISGGLFVMRCKCGLERNKKSLQVIRGNSKQCLRCYKKERKELKRLLIDKHQIVGKSFGRWTVLQYLGAGLYECQCDCGSVMKKKCAELMTLRCLQCERCRRKDLKGGKDTIISAGARSSSFPKWPNSIYSIRKEDLDEQ